MDNDQLKQVGEGNLIARVSTPEDIKLYEENFGIKPEKPMTRRQQRALHKLFSMLADDLNEAGLDQRKVLKPSIEIPWSPKAVKNQLWRQIQIAAVDKFSTTLLTGADINKVFTILNKHLGEKFGVETVFPSIDAQALEALIRQHEKDNQSLKQ